MTRARPAALLLALAVAAAPLGGCYAVRHAFGTDPAGMERTAGHFSSEFHAQVRRTGDRVAGLPEALRRHFAECRRHMVEDPSAFR